MNKPAYSRIMLKLSGESFADPKTNNGISYEIINSIAEQLKEIKTYSIEIAVVVGGGNIFRGYAGSMNGMDRVSADYMGMVATVINAMALQDAMEKKGVYTRVQTAIDMQEIAEPYIRRRAIRHLEKGRVVIFAAGTGNPYFTTDTAAALRALEIDAEVILKATRVDGVYDSDPKLNPSAKMFKKLNYLDVINKDLKVMDATSITLCRDNDLPIIVFNLAKTGNIMRAVFGEHIGTIVAKE